MENFLVGFFGAILGAVGSAFGVPYLKGYSTEKGKNLATHEDLEKLVRQMEAATEATKAIEARIDDQVWNKQRQWEMKRDAVIELVKALSAAEDALMEYSVFHQMALQKENDPKVKALVDEALLRWKEKITEFDGKRFVTRLICSDAFNTAQSGARLAIRKSMKQFLANSVKHYDEVGPIVTPTVKAALAAARKELGFLENDATPQSSGFSAK